MYVPAAFAEPDLSTLHSFMEQHSFGMLISQQDQLPFATHLPLLLQRDDGPQGSLLGHVARANPQWQQLAGQRALAIFAGPHAYISPSWYEAENVVPTWNYVAVHAYGTVQIVEDRDQLWDIVQRSVAVYERSMPQPWAMNDRNTFVDRLLAQIVGFRMEIERIEGKWKLNQNHPIERREKVVRALEQQDDPDGLAIAQMMRSQFPESSFTDFELVEAFEKGTVTGTQWNHRAHVRVAYLYARTMPLDVAIARMRVGLQHLNTIHGAPNTLRRGYHETVTVAFMTLIHELTSRQPVDTSASFCEAHPTVLDKQFLERYYSPDRLWTFEAKTQFVPPDREPLEVL